MIKYTYSVLNSSNNPNYVLLKYLLIIAIIYVIYAIWSKYKDAQPLAEGFSQNDAYILMKNDEIYDDFYAQIYDEIHRPKHRITHELINIINTTKPTTRNSVFLDIGSGTGDVVKYLSDAGYQAFGLDKSHAMVEMSVKKHPDCNFKEGDVLEPMGFEHKSFSHILCTYFTIYHIKDKLSFFRNCYQWLVPNGYLVLHLIDAEDFDTVSPAAKANLVANPNKYTDKKITKSIVKFENFSYNLSYDYQKITDGELCRTEIFKDEATGHVRENEEVLYVDAKENILKIAKYAGFNLYAQFDMKSNLDDEHQYIYILERI